MALSELDEKIYTSLVNDPEAVQALAPHAERLNPGVKIPQYHAKLEASAAIEQAVKPLQEELQKLKQEREEENKKRYWDEQRGELRKRFRMNDEQIAKFEERVQKEFEGRNLGYGDLAEYFALKDQPLTPSGSGSGIGISGQRKGDTEQKWREDVEDPKSGIFARNQNDKKKYLRQKWQEANGEYLNGR